MRVNGNKLFWGAVSVDTCTDKLDKLNLFVKLYGGWENLLNIGDVLAETPEALTPVPDEKREHSLNTQNKKDNGRSWEESDVI